tara:strand:+ start:3829 stop:4104 length:276 start_codon:yes stop_codon:yes gene_type:complete
MSTKQKQIDELADELVESDELLMQMDGYSEACIGVVSSQFEPTRLVYDREKVIELIMQDGCSRVEAEEFHWYNQAGAYMGENTPLFFDKFD